MALAQRVIPSLDTVFTDEGVLFRGNDAWYHARLIEHDAVGIGSLLQHDPYLRMPGGQQVAVAPLFDKIGGTVAKAALGFRRADQNSGSDLRTVHTVAAYLPAILGALIVLPVFLLAHTLWGPIAAWTASVGFIAVPGQLLNRSLLGATDHHVAEVLFSTTALALLIKALDRHQTNRRQGILWAVLAGLALAAYQLSWVASMLLPITLIVWLLAAALLRTLPLAGSPRPKGNWSAPECVSVSAATALIVVYFNIDGIRVPNSTAAVNALLIAIAAGFSVISPRRSKSVLSLVKPRAVIITAILGSLLVGWLVLVSQGQLAESFRQYASFAIPRPEALTVNEAKPLFFSGGGWVPLWRELGMGWLVALPGLTAMGWDTYRRRSTGDLLILGWAVVIMLLTLSQIRFAYYLSIVSVLAAASMVARLLVVKQEASPRTWRASALAIMGVALLFVGPNLRATTARMKEPATISPAWVETLDWLREETPAPFPNQDCYYTSPGTDSDVCLSSYGVFSWWDFGYWITQRARRVPHSNPTQAGAREAAQLLLSTDSEQAINQLEEAHARYLVVDAMLSILQPAPRAPRGKFPAMAMWIGRNTKDYFETVLVADPEGRTRPAMLFYEEFFRTLVVHLVTTGGQEFKPDRIPVVELEPQPKGPRLVRSIRFFADYEKATLFIQEKEAEDTSVWKIASLEALASPLPLAKVGGIEQVFSSTAIVARHGSHTVPMVRVFRVSNTPIDGQVELTEQ